MTVRERVWRWLHRPHQPVIDDVTCPRCGETNESDRVFCAACWGHIHASWYAGDW